MLREQPTHLLSPSNFFSSSPPSPDTKYLLMDTVIGLSEGTGDYAIYMWDEKTRKLIGIARQVQQIWAIRNEDDIKEGIQVKL